MKNRTLLFILISVASLGISGCSKGFADKSPMVAKVNGEKITESDIKNVLRTVRPNMPVLRNEDERKLLLDNIITTTLLMQEAKAQKMDTQEEVHFALKRTRQEILARALIGKYLQDNKITEDAIRQHYEKLKQQKEYDVRHILLETEDAAKAVIAQLNKGKAFSKLAKAKSIDIESGKRGGKLGWISESMVVPEFFQTVSTMKPKTISAVPVKSDFGWHVIRLDASRKAKLPPLENIKGKILERLRAEKIKSLTEHLQAKAKVVYPEK